MPIPALHGSHSYPLPIACLPNPPNAFYLRPLWLEVPGFLSLRTWISPKEQRQLLLWAGWISIALSSYVSTRKPKAKRRTRNKRRYRR